MVKTYKVQINKVNGQPFVNLSKKEGWREGDSIVPQLDFGIIHNEETLIKYHDENIERLLELKNKLLELNDSYFKNSEHFKFIMGELPSDIFGLGEVVGGHDEPYYFEEQGRCDFDFLPYGDIDGGVSGDITYSLGKFIELRKDNEFGLGEAEKAKKELINLAKVRFIRDLLERHIDKYNAQNNKICSEYGFEPPEVQGDLDDTLYNGRIYLKFFEGNANMMSITDYHQKHSIDI